MFSLDETKNRFIKGRLAFKRKDLTQQDVAEARAYINAYWPKLIRSFKKDDDTLLGLPKPYIVPAFEKGHEFDFNELYYWDNYFMIQGLLDEEHKELVSGILDDLVELFNRLKVIPNASRLYLTGRSQPPLLTSIIYDLYQTYGYSLDWLAKNIDVAKQEYATVWMGTEKPNVRQVYKGLSRYYDVNYINELAETESGWDMTPRFNHKALEYLPVDLNALLYKYEWDFAKTERLLGNIREAIRWEQTAKLRLLNMNELMWDEGRGMYFDYNYVKKKRGTVNSLAAYYPMWAGMTSDRQARQLVKSLSRFENKGGLATTDAIPLGHFVMGAVPMQWAFPNGWAPLHFMVIKGLQRYGYHEDAKRISLKWIRTNLQWFNDHGVFLEKYNVVNPDKPPAKGLYPSQTGFGWTNSIFEFLCREYIDRQ